MDVLREWYLLLSRLSATFATPVAGLSTRVQLPLASAFLFGLVGALAPCQITTNLSAMAYVGRGGTRATAAREAVAFLLGKALVYTVLGTLALALGAGLQRAAVPAAVATRRALGPILLLMGIAMLGAFRLRGGFGTRLAARVEAFRGRAGARAPFLMGCQLSRQDLLLLRARVQDHLREEPREVRGRSAS